ncbi:MAG: hypothetical protein IJY09_08875 [Lachnospiraceae bacterium]|nr:hypothetical protein [Lachnospiraceae bacterium]
MAGKGSYRKVILELVLVSGIFAIVSVFLVRLYMSANRLQEKAVAVSSATVCCQTLAEKLKVLGVEQTLAQYETRQEEQYYIIDYDAAWEQTEEVCYQVAVAFTEAEEGLRFAEVLAAEADIMKLLKNDLQAEEEELLLCHLKVAVSEAAD